MKKLIVPISLVVMALAVAAMLPALVSAETTSDRSSLCYTFTKNFGVGSEGEHVARLTQALIKDGVLSGVEKVFDEDLAAAVVKFQNKYGIPTTGYVGPLTRAKLNSLYGCGTQGNSTGVRYECPPGYVCTPVGQQTSTTLCPVGFTCTANSSTHLENSTEKGDAAYNFFVTLLRRVPDTQGSGWNYFKYYSGSIDQMRQEFLSGIEYTTKQKVIQIFKDVYNREPDDLELTKWYYIAEYNGYNVDVVRSALKGYTPTTYVTPVQTTSTCPTGFTCSESTFVTPVNPGPVAVPVITPVNPGPSPVSYLPVAKILISGEKSHAYNVGETNHFEWMSKFGDSFSSYSKANNPTQCGEGPWVATTDHGTSDTYLGSQWAGCVWTVTYVVNSSRTGQSASDSVTVTVNPLSSGTTSVSGSRDAARQ